MPASTSTAVVNGSELARVRVSVVVPAFERVEPLRELLRSLARQELAAGAFEVVVSDDGSGPQVELAVREVAHGFSRLTFVHGPNAGPGVARNRGAAAALAPVLAFVDSDCLVAPGWLEALTRAVEDGAPLAHGPVTSSVPAFEPFVHSFQVDDDPICGANFAVTRRAFDAIGGFRVEISRIAEDHDLFVRFRRAGHRATFVRSATVVHPPRLKRVSISIVPSERARAVYRDLATFYRLVPEHRGDLVTASRRGLLKAAAKLSILLAPLAFLPPAGWAAGVLPFAFIAARKWWLANRMLRRGGERLRVPASEAVRYALSLPIADAVALAQRARYGLVALR